jgi:flagellar basal body rod protein FlgB
MTQNNLAYQAAVKILKKKHGMLSYAISGGR